jgi:hypothetical protein
MSTHPQDEPVPYGEDMNPHHPCGHDDPNEHPLCDYCWWNQTHCHACGSRIDTHGCLISAFIDCEGPA